MGEISKGLEMFVVKEGVGEVVYKLNTWLFFLSTTGSEDWFRTVTDPSSSWEIMGSKKGLICCRLGSIMTKASAGMSDGADRVKSSPGRMMVLDWALTNLWVDLVSIVSRARREGGED